MGQFQADPGALLTDLDWGDIFRKRPDLDPPGYGEAVERGKERSGRRYEQQGKRRAGKGGKSKPVRFPSLKHGTD